MNIDSPSRLADFVASTLPSLNTMVRQELLETFNVRKRLETLIRELSKEQEVLELRNKIHEQVQEQVNQSQREYLLREQMKAIQKELGESDDGAGRSRRASQEGRRVRDVRRSEEGVRARTEAAREDDSGFGRVHGLADVSRMDDFAAVEQDFRHGRGSIDIAQGAGNPRRGSLRPGEGEAAHPRLPGGEETAAGNEGADPVLRRASRRGQDFAREIDRARDGPQVRAHFARRHARRSGNPRPSAHVHRRFAGADHSGNSPRRDQGPRPHAGRGGQARARFPRRSVGGVDGSARSGAELDVPRSLSGRAVRFVEGAVHRHGELDGSDSGTAARPHGNHRTRGLHRRGKGPHREPVPDPAADEGARARSSASRSSSPTRRCTS